MSQSSGWLNCNHSRRCKRCGGAERCTVHKTGTIHICRDPDANTDAEAQRRKRETGTDGSQHWVWYESDFLDPSIKKPIWLTQELPLALEQPYLHQIYEELLTFCPLNIPTIDTLLKRYGFRDEMGEARKRELISLFKEGLLYRSIPREQKEDIVKALLNKWGKAQIARVPGFIKKEGVWTLNFPNTAGLVFPVRDESGLIVALKIRLDHPHRPGERYLSFSSANYGGPKCNATIHHPVGIQRQIHLQQVRVVEGELKADISWYLSGIPTISIPGVSSWAKTFPALEGLYGKWGQRIRDVRVAFDADARYKPRVAASLEALCNEIALLSDKHYFLKVEIWNEHDGKGIDDVLAIGGLIDIKEGAEAIELLHQITTAAGLHTLDEHFESILDEIKSSGSPDIFAQEDTVKTLARVSETAILRLHQVSRDFLGARFPAQQLAKAIAEYRKRALLKSQDGTTLDAAEAGLPILELHDRRTSIIGDVAREALERMNDPPRLFKFGDSIAKLKAGGAGMEPLHRPTLLPELERAAIWVKTTKAGVRTIVPCPSFIADYMMNTPETWDSLPAVEGIVSWPCLAPDTYKVIQHPGYDWNTKYIYIPKWTTQLPTISPYPDQNEIQESINAFKYVLQDFPFADQASFANAFGLIFTHTLFLDIKEKPLFIIEAPTIGSGKGKLLDVLTIPFTREQVARSPYAQDREEVRKRLLSLLMPLPTHVLFDNVAYTLDSDALALALTTNTYSDRELGKSRNQEIPVRCIWCATGNNIRASPEIARRIVRIRIDTNEEKPYLRTGFAIPNLDEWLRTQGWILQYHALRLTNAWIAAGCPKWTERSFGSYPTWAEKIGGILSVIGIPGFLSNMDQYTSWSNSSEDFMAVMVQEIVPLIGKEANFTVKSIYNLVEGVPALATQLAGREEGARRTSLGSKLAQCNGMVYGNHKLVRIDNGNNLATFCFKERLSLNGK